MNTADTLPRPTRTTSDHASPGSITPGDAADVPVIRARGLGRRYGRGRSAHQAVTELDLTVRRGELFALLGTNGAGKTSTLELLEGLATPSAGTVEVFGLDPVRERSRVRPRQGLMLQTGGFPSDLTTAEALRMWCATLGAARPVADVLADLDLSDRAGTRISSLSGGEVRRLDLACALAADPELLFLDEPTTGLDPESRARAWELIASLRARGTTIVLTTHYLEEAERLADRLAIMHAGRIVREGTVAQVIAGHPARIRTTLTAGAPALPVLHGAARREQTGRVEIATAELAADLESLLAWAREQGLELTGLDARAASLETVFLEIAGGTAPASGTAA